MPQQGARYQYTAQGLYKYKHRTGQDIGAYAVERLTRALCTRQRTSTLYTPSIKKGHTALSYPPTQHPCRARSARPLGLP